ncbi:MAG: bifunctional alpha,alpha-trehalose-phosphate synthase (UDP-forming)/trehalose-phosphatase [Candidatus Cloacimonetes bacterium]|nr:bifunctional alpha,alpha-trehalose-phosphate synthase (UDP-forming)/trehalose-phosphatase [Candidatus Cloacimonadota bacterium]
MRLLIVSNRLPVAVSKKNNRYELTKSAGGLVSGLTDYLNSLERTKSTIDDFLWMGWPGMSIDRSDEELISKKVKEIFKAAPVFFSQSLMDKVYLGFCNKTIWPLFHYFLNYTKFDMEFWDSYKKMNEIFCEELLKAIQPDDIIWVHDYHLMLLPALLRKKIDNPIGFFLHIPFPAFEVYRTLPKEPRSEILKGLLGSDLIGFHTHDYTQYFLRCVLRILGYESYMGEISFHDRIVKVGTFPMGIDYEKFHDMDVTPFRSSKPRKNEMKIVLSVDRLDYSKGIVNRLEGFELFLKKNPQWHKKVYMNMIVVPSRTGVQSYQKIKSNLDELVGKINGDYGSIDWTPIIYQYTSLPHKELIAQYRMSNVSLLTPLRDGMNLVAKEYVASLTDKKGVLVLSEFTGAAKELSESIIINPNNIEEIADAIAEALEIPIKKQVRYNSIMQERLKRYNVTRWATDFIDRLQEIHQLSVTSFNKKRFIPKIKNKILADYQQAQKRFIALNYDGILIPMTKDYRDAIPTPEIKILLRALAAKGKTDVIINSGRSKEYMDKYLAKIPLHLTAEHGTWIKEANEAEWMLHKPFSTEWKEEIIPVLETYTDRLPGSMIEEKELSVSWHYHKADIEQASYISKELVDNLLSITLNLNIQVSHGNKVVEVFHSGIDKSELMMFWLEKKKYDFIMVIGDDWSDEELFKVLPDNTYSIKVGKIYTDARYMLKTQADAIKLLECLTKT